MFSFLVRIVQLWMKPYQVNLWSWKFADTKLHSWTNSDGDDFSHEMVTAEGEWRVEEVQTEPPFGRSVYRHRAVIQDVQELKWHSPPFLPVTLKKRSMPHRWTRQPATSFRTPPSLPANGVILITSTECHRAKDSEVPHINNSTPSLIIFLLLFTEIITWQLVETNFSYNGYPDTVDEWLLAVAYRNEAITFVFVVITNTDVSLFLRPSDRLLKDSETVLRAFYRGAIQRYVCPIYRMHGA